MNIEICENHYKVDTLSFWSQPSKQKDTGGQVTST